MMLKKKKKPNTLKFPVYAHNSQNPHFELLVNAQLFEQ